MIYISFWYIVCRWLSNRIELIFVLLFVESLFWNIYKPNSYKEVIYKKFTEITKPRSELNQCGIGIDTTVPTNTIQVPNTTGTVTDSGSVYMFINCVYSIYRTGEL